MVNLRRRSSGGLRHGRTSVVRVYTGKTGTESDNSLPVFLRFKYLPEPGHSFDTPRGCKWDRNPLHGFRLHPVRTAGSAKASFPRPRRFLHRLARVDVAGTQKFEMRRGNSGFFHQSAIFASIIACYPVVWPCLRNDSILARQPTAPTVRALQQPERK